MFAIFLRFFCRDETRSLNTKRRWIPPSAIRRDDALTQESKNDILFRKVRSFSPTGIAYPPNVCAKLSRFCRSEVSSTSLLRKNSRSWVMTCWPHNLIPVPSSKVSSCWWVEIRGSWRFKLVQVFTQKTEGNGQEWCSFFPFYQVRDVCSVDDIDCLVLNQKFSFF